MKKKYSRPDDLLLMHATLQHHCEQGREIILHCYLVIWGKEGSQRN